MNDIYVKEKEIIRILDLLNKSEVDYILMRNINNEIPNSLRIGKDIDILVRKGEIDVINNFFDSNKYKKVRHPLKQDVFLYGVDKFEFRYNKEFNIYFDLNFHILVRSLDLGQWIPLDQDIQKSAWTNKRFEQVDDAFGYWTLSFEDEFICLIARSIFDKKEFQIGYMNRVKELIQLIDKEDVMKKLDKIFFKFTPNLIKCIEDDNYNCIVEEYLKFKEY